MNTLSERETATETIVPALDFDAQLEFQDGKESAQENTA